MNLRRFFPMSSADMGTDEPVPSEGYGRISADRPLGRRRVLSFRSTKRVSRGMATGPLR